MFIDANEITALIKKYEELEHMRAGLWMRRPGIIHPNAIIKDLEGLIDVEVVRQEAAMDKMAEDYEDEEYGKLECEDAAIEKQLSVQNWPGGI
tara:strand:- start:795 stop:1073 length:279 start_codon:yes stop_codon:yes gene_type:complete